LFLAESLVTHKDAQISESSCDEDSTNDDSTCIWHPGTFDIGEARKENLDDITKVKVITETLLPNEPFEFPVNIGKTQKRAFQQTWVTESEGFPLLAYSKFKDAVFCKQCFLFFTEAQRVGKGSHERASRLVTGGYRDWKKARAFFTKHASSEYHKTCVTLAENFVQIRSGKRKDVLSVIDSNRAVEIQRNRAALKGIIETTLFCAEQELALLGNNDSGPLSLEKPAESDGNFRSLLRFRVNAGDTNLKKHVVESAWNATYTSPDIQNEIIEVCS